MKEVQIHLMFNSIHEWSYYLTISIVFLAVPLPTERDIFGNIVRLHAFETPESGMFPIGTTMIR